jgi:hypothetical protein
MFIVCNLQLWNFNNNLYDSVSGYALIPSSALWAYTTDRFGVYNSAMWFKGAALAINATSASVWFSGNLTLSFWLYIDSTQGNPRYFQCGTKTSGSNMIQVGWQFAGPNSDILWGIVDGPSYLWSNISVIYSSWNHRAVISGGSGSSYTTTVYTNLVSGGSVVQDQPGLRSNNLATCYFGYSWWGDQGTGYLDDVVFYRRALSFAELTTLYSINFVSTYTSTSTSTSTMTSSSTSTRTTRTSTSTNTPPYNSKYIFVYLQFISLSKQTRA